MKIVVRFSSLSLVYYDKSNHFVTKFKAVKIYVYKKISEFNKLVPTKQKR